MPRCLFLSTDLLFSCSTAIAFCLDGKKRRGQNTNRTLCERIGNLGALAEGAFSR